MTMQELKIFEEKQIRTIWDEVQEKWYFSIVDIVQILTESKDYLTARKYWNKLKQRLLAEGNETVTNCHQLKLRAAKARAEIERQSDVEYIPKKEAIDLLGVCDATLWHWARSGYLVLVKLGRRVFYRRTDIQRLLSR